MSGFNTPINIKVCQTVLKSTNQLRSLQELHLKNNYIKRLKAKVWKN